MRQCRTHSNMLCMHVCMHACMHVCMYVCMHVCVPMNLFMSSNGFLSRRCHAAPRAATSNCWAVGRHCCRLKQHVPEARYRNLIFSQPLVLGHQKESDNEDDWVQSGDDRLFRLGSERRSEIHSMKTFFGSSAATSQWIPSPPASPVSPYVHTNVYTYICIQLYIYIYKFDQI